MKRPPERTLLLLGGGFEQCAAVRVAHDLGFRVLVADDDPHPAAASLADEVLCSRLKDPERLHADLCTRNFDGVFTHAAELAIVQAGVAERFGLPGPSSRTARLGTLKDLRIEALAAGGVRVPAHRVLAPGAPATAWTAAAVDVGFPLVAKPNDDKGARGVQLLRDDAELLRYRAEHATSDTAKPFLLERWERGLQLSTESLVLGGEPRWTNIALRHYDGMERFHPYLIEDGHSMGIDLAPGLRPRIEELTRRSARALGLADGVLKGDLLVPSEGDPFVLEMAVRTSGGRFLDLVAPLHHGVNLLDPLIRLAMGEPIEPAALAPRRPTQGVSQRFLLPPPGSTLRGLPDLERILREPHVQEVVFQPGFLATRRQEQVRSHHDRIGYVVCTGRDRAEADARALALARRLEGELLDPRPPLPLRAASALPQ